MTSYSIEFLGRYKGGILAFLVALIGYLFISSQVPLQPGRDFETYFVYYEQFWEVAPANLTCQLFRTPVAPLFFGLLFDLGGQFFVEIGLGLVLCIGAFVFGHGAPNRMWWCGGVVMAFLCLSEESAILLRSVASEGVCAILLLYLIGTTLWAARGGSQRWVWVGCILVLLALSRPGNQLMIMCCFSPLILKENWIIRIRATIVCLAVFITGLIIWSGINGYRYNEFRVASLGKAHIPFFRVFCQDKLYHPDNGPNSKELNNVVNRRQDWLNQYGVKANELMHYQTGKDYQLLLKWVPEDFGWDKQWDMMMESGLEAMFSKPYKFWSTYAHHFSKIIGIQKDHLFFGLNKEKHLLIESMRNRRDQLIEEGRQVADEDLMPELPWWWLSHRPPNYQVNEDPIFRWIPTRSKWEIHNADSKGSFYDSIYSPTIWVCLILTAFFIALGAYKASEVSLILAIYLSCLVTLMVTLIGSVYVEFRVLSDVVLYSALVFSFFEVSGNKNIWASLRKMNKMIIITMVFSFIALILTGVFSAPPHKWFDGKEITRIKEEGLNEKSFVIKSGQRYRLEVEGETLIPFSVCIIDREGSRTRSLSVDMDSNWTAVLKPKWASKDARLKGFVKNGHDDKSLYRGEIVVREFSVIYYIIRDARTVFFWLSLFLTLVALGAILFRSICAEQKLAITKDRPSTASIK